MEDSKVLLEVKNLKKYFNTPKGLLHAVDDVNFSIREGKTLGVVGESGCGKSTTGRVILRLLEATDGEILFEGKNIRNYTKEQMIEIRQKMQIIFQDPFASLNPRMTVSEIIAEPLIIHGIYKNREERDKKVMELMETVGLSERLINTYPHELDGGRRQRIGIARALAVQPDFIVCDEPISALDVSIQAQVVNLMQKLQHEQGLTYLFIAHDLSMVKYISDRIGVMHWGKLLEVGPADEIYHNPIHPYTKSLLSAIPEPDPERERKRQHLIYDSSIENDGEKRQMYEIRPGHFVYATEAEAKNYKEEA